MIIFESLSIKVRFHPGTWAWLPRSPAPFAHVALLCFLTTCGGDGSAWIEPGLDGPLDYKSQNPQPAQPLEVAQKGFFFQTQREGGLICAYGFPGGTGPTLGQETRRGRIHTADPRPDPFLIHRALKTRIALGSLAPDPEPRKGGISKELSVMEDTLHVCWKADEARILRVSISSFLEHLSLVVETMDLFQLPVA